MEEYISKSAVVAEIKRRLWLLVPKMTFHQQRLELEKLLSFINTLEVKEVDLDTEQRHYLTKHFNVYDDGILQSKKSQLPLSTYDVIKVAKHFFELGMQISNKAQKGKEV